MILNTKISNNKRPLIAVSATTILIFVWLFVGFYRDREWRNLYIFIKHRPTVKLMFNAPRGEADPSSVPEKEGWLTPQQEVEEEAYVEFVERHDGWKRSLSIPFF
jgi:hypothetical protein